MTYAYAPQAPFAAWPKQLHERELGFCIWYTSPGTIVTQTQCPRATLELSQTLGGRVYECLQACTETNRALGGTLVVHDWRSLTEVDTEARADYTKRLEGLRRGQVREAVMAIPPQRALVRAAVHFASMVLPFRTGHRTRFVDDVDALRATIADLRLAVPDPDEEVPGLDLLAAASAF